VVCEPLLVRATHGLSGSLLRLTAMSSLINIAAMQVGWFACVLGAANQLPWIGTLVSLAVAALHLARAAQPRVEAALILWAVAIGMVLDSALASSGLLTFASGVWVAGFTTHWMLGLWIGFATTLNASLQWLMQRPIVAIAFGAAGGPLAYGSGAKLGALTLTSLATSLTVIGIGWAIAMWMFVQLTRRLNTAAATEAVPA